MATTQTTSASGQLNCWRRCPGTIVTVPSSEGARFECNECGQTLGQKADLEELADGSSPVAALAEAILDKAGDAHGP